MMKQLILLMLLLIPVAFAGEISDNVTLYNDILNITINVDQLTNFTTLDLQTNVSFTELNYTGDIHYPKLEIIKNDSNSTVSSFPKVNNTDNYSKDITCTAGFNFTNPAFFSSRVKECDILYVNYSRIFLSGSIDYLSYSECQPPAKRLAYTLPRIDCPGLNLFTIEYFPVYSFMVSHQSFGITRTINVSPLFRYNTSFINYTSQTITQDNISAENQTATNPYLVLTNNGSEYINISLWINETDTMYILKASNESDVNASSILTTSNTTISSCIAPGKNRSIYLWGGYNSTNRSKRGNLSYDIQMCKGGGS